MHPSSFHRGDLEGKGQQPRRRRRERKAARNLAWSLAATALAITMSGPLSMSPALASASPLTPSGATPLVTVDTAPTLPPGAQATGSIARTTELSGAVALKLPDPQAVTSFINDASNPYSPTYEHYLAANQFAGRFGPSPATIAAVKSQLSADRLTVTGVSSNGLLVEFRGTAATVESAFDTSLETVHLADGSTGQTTISAVRLPASIAGQVQAVIGLDRLVKETAGPPPATAVARGALQSPQLAKATSGGPAACSQALAQQKYGALTDQQVANSYGLDPLYGAGDLASGQTIDVYELEPFEMSDIAKFDQCYFGTNNSGNVSVTTIDGGPGTGYGSAEAALDIEDVSAIAPGAKINVFEGPNMDDEWGPLDTWNQIAIADDARQISSSWGICEPVLEQGAPGVEQVENEIFEQIAAQGQTVFNAAGDDGSDSCADHGGSAVAPDLSVLDPADQPYVTSVGGTTILDPTDPPQETVWNNGSDGGAGGGGISTGWAQQPWQSDVAVPQSGATEVCSNDPSGRSDNYHDAGIPTTLPAKTLCRETPDVSALADPQTGITIVFGGAWYQYGGTSSAAPLWAAMLAEINASASCSSSSNGVGFVDPALYQIADHSTTYADAFNDVTVGNNDNLGVGADDSGYPFYQAGTGYDMASGLGTPQVTNATNTGLSEQLCAIAMDGAVVQPKVTSVLTASDTSDGPTTGGTPVTINGANFGGSPGAVYFGDVHASIGSWTAASITVATPAYYSPPGTPAGMAGSANVTVVTATGESSSLNAAAVFHYDGNSSGLPVIDYVGSPGGPGAGGSALNADGEVDLFGTGFSGATSVSFGGVAVSLSPANVLGDNEIAVTPPADTGAGCLNGGIGATGVCAVAVSVTTPEGTSLTPTDGGPPILPAYAGPIVFSPNGSFSPACMTSTSPTCEVTQAPEEYDYSSTPSVSSVTVQDGGGYASEFGGSVATLVGKGFNLLTLEWVNVGSAGPNGNEDFDVINVDRSSLTVVLPPTIGAITTDPVLSRLSVQTLAGRSNSKTFDYAGIPVFGSIGSPNPPIVAQATPGAISVTGEGLSDVYAVSTELEEPLSFLASTTTDITSQTDTSLTANLLSNYAFPQDVLLCTASGCTAPSSATGGSADVIDVAYPGRPVVSSSSPSSGPAQGGTEVTIQGALDSEVVAVNFGAVPATILSEGELTASAPINVLVPPGMAGKTVNITIETAGGILVGKPTSAVNSAATFTYHASPPTAPRNLEVSSENGFVSASWEAPANDGGDPITGYRVVATAAGQKSITRTLAPNQTTTRIALSVDATWKITVRALNELGAGLRASATS